MLHFAKRMISLIVAVVIAVSLFLPVWSVNHWNQNEYVSGDTVEVETQLFSDVEYLRIIGAGQYSISNSEILTIRLFALTGNSYLLPGIPATINGDIVGEEIEAMVEWDFGSFPANMYQLLTYEEAANEYFIIRSIMWYGVDYLFGSSRLSELSRDHFSEHSRVLLVVDNRWPDDFAGRWGPLPSDLLAEARNATWNRSVGNTSYDVFLPSYVLYKTEMITVYMLQIPL